MAVRIQSTASDRPAPPPHPPVGITYTSPWGEANRRRAQLLARLFMARARHPLLGWVAGTGHHCRASPPDDKSR